MPKRQPLKPFNVELWLRCFEILIPNTGIKLVTIVPMGQGAIVAHIDFGPEIVGIFFTSRELEVRFVGNRLLDAIEDLKDDLEWGESIDSL